MKKEDTLLLEELLTFYYYVYTLSQLLCLLCTTPNCPGRVFHNHFYNILRLSDGWANFPFTKSERKGGY